MCEAMGSVGAEARRGSPMVLFLPLELYFNAELLKLIDYRKKSRFHIRTGLPAAVLTKLV